MEFDEMADDLAPCRASASDVGRREFDDVYTSERIAVTRLAFLIVHDRAVAEELAQEAFIRLYLHFADVQNPSGFLRTVVVRLGINWRNRYQMERQRLALVATSNGVGAEDEPVIDETWQALGRLAPERSAVLVLRFYEDLSYSEIATIVGATAATIRSRTRRALADLRKELQP